ncbi:kinase-like protein [Coniophora puteana RWD-64-598 SS2]|uniref:mitogen-activated protein kinase kinase n=1 Tax=Coniophora puteana (strain RWD-64-598) TaxID=741705 RepID=A0A5M3MVI0_CONPW|nr:kinase-like protein [Coniophora puteana RWD-64-598 SS2]EIW83136.1 kinase-like protein [Coniophora puteana RWD-64-598 SS2]
MPLELQESPELKTVRPILRINTPRQEEVDNEVNNIIDGVRKINVHVTRANSDASNDADSPKDEIHQGQPLEWSDDVFAVLSRLGEGNGGAVFKVQDKRTGKVMARKTITAREAPPQQLKRELTISSTADHFNIIRFFGAYVSPSTSEVNVLMEYCQGGSLAAVSERIKARNARIGEKVAGRIAEGVLSGLAYLHSLKTIHRDIKPSNILMTAEGVVKLCDFGVSGELVRSIVNTFTGTSLYMAPERIRGQSYSIRADVWSTGLTLLEIVQNHYPFPEDLTSIELLVYITNGEPPQLSDDEDVRWSDEMKDFVRQTLTIDANDRPTPRDMLSHPWIINVMKKEVLMSRWIGEVWGWKNGPPKVTGS